MKGTLIRELDIHHLDGTFYEATKKYLEKHGCTWVESRIDDQLEGVHIIFPSGTIYKKLSSTGEIEQFQILFEKDGIVHWNRKRKGQFNSISVPYVYL